MAQKPQSEGTEMGQIRSIVVGCALFLSQTAVAAAADLGLPPPEPEPCVGCSGPWYLKGFVGAANPDVDSIFADEFRFNDTFVVHHKDIKSSPLGGLASAMTPGITSASTSPVNIAAAPSSSRRTPTSSSVQARTNTRPISKAGSAWPMPISISAPGTVSPLTSAAALALLRSMSRV
jgi:hypothetical protein